MFIPVFIGEKNGKNRPRIARVIVKNKVAILSGHGVVIEETRCNTLLLPTSLVKIPVTITAAARH